MKFTADVLEVEGHHARKVIYLDESRAAGIEAAALKSPPLSYWAAKASRQ